MDGMALGSPPAPFLGVERSVCGRRWRTRDADPGLAAAIAERHGLPEIVGRLLAQRGIGLDEAPGFLAPRLRDQLPDPLHLRDMDRAVARLSRAVRDGEPIVVFGDYDVDGATSAALLLRFFASVGAHASVYVPDRMREGYGPNAPALLRLKAEGAAVVVTVDGGATAHEPLAAAAAAGLDVIVIDHHVTEPLLPPALALVNPNRLDEESPHGVLAAVGVAFLLVVALNRALREVGWYRDRIEPDLLQWLDLVALGTVCDVVPLSGINRALVESTPQAPALVFAAAEGWHLGVIGIVAARLKERYERPACVVALADGFGKGSGRSVPGLALGPAVIAARQAGLLINGGGHAMAAGFTVAEDKLDRLREFLVERLGDGLATERLVPELAIDGALSVAATQSGIIDHISALAPFGAANPEPRFAFPGVQIAFVE